MARTNVAFYHPVLFFLIGALAIAELGLTAYRISKYNDVEPNPYPSDEFAARIKFILFCAVWTTLFALLHWVFNLLIGIVWTFITWIFWLVASIMFHYYNNLGDLECDSSFFKSICRQRNAIEAISWTEFGLLTFLFLASLFHIHSRRHAHGGYMGSARRGYHDTSA